MTFTGMWDNPLSTTAIRQVSDNVEKVTGDIYLKDAENGFKTFFDFSDFRFGEGVISDDNGNDFTTYYIFDFSYDDTIHYRVSERAMNEALKVQFTCPDEYKGEMLVSLLVELNIIKIIE